MSQDKFEPGKAFTEELAKIPWDQYTQEWKRGAAAQESKIFRALISELSRRIDDETTWDCAIDEMMDIYDRAAKPKARP